MIYRFFSLFFCLIALHSYGQKYSFGKEADWVKMSEIPQSSTVKKYEVSQGYYYTLADYQVNLDKNLTYSRTVNNVITYSGITKASQLSVTYDTSYQKLVIHHVYIWRNKEKIDRTKDLSLKILNNEYNLHNGIYMGLITLYCNLDDIRKDDLIDFSYTLEGKNPIFKNDQYLFIPLQSNNPIDLYCIRILYSKDKNYHFKMSGQDSATVMTDKVNGPYRELEFYLKDVKPYEQEENMPAWEITYPYFTLSSFNSWLEVNTWAQEVFALKKEPDLKEVFKEVFKGNESTDDKINKLINYVQDDIRYMGIETGIGSIKPFAPDQVVKQRFGDCKDKSLLLVSLLKKIGISKAYPVLVNTYMKNTLSKFYPSNEVFDHCIVRFEHNDSVFWVDPTLTQQGGSYRTISGVDFGKTLVVGLPSDSLMNMDFINNKALVDITEEFNISSFTDPAELKIVSVRKNFDADMRRAMFEQYSADDYSKFVMDDLKRYIPVVNKKEDMVLHDDIVNNVFSTTYKYEIDGFWQDGDKLKNIETLGYWIYKYEPSTLYPELSSSTCIDRQFDYALNYPLNMVYTAIFHFPKDLLLQDSYKKRETEAFYFDERIEQINKNSFKVVYHYHTKKPSLTPESYKKFCEEKNEISKNLPIIIYFNK